MTQHLPLPPEKELIEREIADLFSNGDFTALARLLQREYSAITRAFSTTDETRHNPVFQFLIHLWGFDQLKDGLSDTVLNIILRERAKWQPVTKQAKSSSELSGKVGHELMEAFEAEIGGHDYNEQIAEWMDVENAARAKKESVIAQRNDFYCNGNLRQFAASRAKEKVA